MRALVALLLLICQFAIAQTSPHAKKARKRVETNFPLPSDWPILSLTVTGNQQFPSDAILNIAGIKVGDKATKESFEAARQRVVDTGLFDSVGFEYKATGGNKPGYAAVFQVVEVKPLYKVEFAGFSGPPQEPSAYLKSHDPLYQGVAPPTQPLMDHWARMLEAYLAEKNHPQRVIGKLISTGPTDYVIRLQPDAPLPAVARIEFTGNDVLDEATLQNTIGGVAYGLPYTEENFRELLDNQLRPMYEARGMLRVRFEDIRTEPVPLPTKGLLVHVKVIEGAVYKFGKVRVTGVDADQSDALAQMAALKPGAVADFDAVNQAVEKVQKAVRRAGFYRVTSASERKLDDTAKKVDVTIKVAPGARYLMGNLTIKGLDINGEAAVRKLWGEKPGSAFNADYPEHFLTEVRGQGIFDYLGPTKSDVKIDDAAHTADVALIFGAAPVTDQRKKRQAGGPF